MPVWGRRGSYAAVTYTAVALVGVAVVANLARPLIPPPEPNQLDQYRARFLERASKQGVDWRIADSSAFADARRLGRPVMVFAGSAVSQAARRMDSAVFSNREVAARLNRDFISVRVDTDLEPEWRSAFLPMLRNSLSDSGYTILFFSPDGVLLTWLARRTWVDDPDFNDFIGRLGEIVDEWHNLKPGDWTQAQREHAEERAELRGGGSRAVPDIDAFVQSLTAPRLFWRWQGGRYRVLLQSGDYASLKVLLETDLRGPRADLVDGGFFRIVSGEDMRLVEFDKSAADCAEMLAVLAHAYVQTNDELFKFWYGRSLEALQEQFMGSKPWSTHVETEVLEDGRSARHSFGAAAQRTSFDSELRAATAELGLVAKDNPLMVPYVATTTLPTDSIIEKLKKAGDETAVVLPRDDFLDVSAFVVARVYEAASVMQDDAALASANQWAERLEEFRAGTNEVRHSTQGRGMARKWLGDFTAYADAAFEAYAATGDEGRLHSGEAVLRRAIELFAQQAPGDYLAGLPGNIGVAIEMPSIVDTGWPPALPSLMLLCFRYGAVLGDKELRQRAVEIAERFSPAANANPILFPSFFAAAQEVMVTGCTVVANDEPFIPSAQPRPFRAAASNTESTTGRARYVRAEVRR